MPQPISRLKIKHLTINHKMQQHQYNGAQSNISDPLLDRKIEDVAAGCFHIIQMCLANCHYQIKKML
jgi:hypothetical protein